MGRPGQNRAARHEPGRQLRLSARQTDVLYVADAFEAMRHVNGLLRA